MTPAGSVAAEDPEWGATRARNRETSTAYAALVLLVAAFIGVAAVVVGLVWGVGAGVIAAVAGIAFVAWWVGRAPTAALNAAGARSLAPDDHPRLWNIASGLAVDLSSPVPALFLITEGGPNALVCRRRGPAIAVTRSLLESYTRTELEAVVAHCLVRSRSPHLHRVVLATALGPLGSFALPVAGFDDDVRAAAVTRYPPALAAAIEKAEPRSGRWSPFWFVGVGPAHRPAPDRIAALEDL
ncbi:MAG: hypothetical protein M3238_08220 [Actinomycetota bacterium]|nr:hypothetical protein [Actinomycetota bacterium]